MTDEKIKRINELDKISKERPLSKLEKEEQTNLREEYISSIKSDLRSSLDRIKLRSK